MSHKKPICPDNGLCRVAHLCPEQDSTVSLYQRPTRSLYSALGTEGHRPIKCPKSDNSHLSWGTNCDITISESLVRKGAVGSFRHPRLHLGNSSQLGSTSLILETNFPYCQSNLTPFFQETTEHRGPPWGGFMQSIGAVEGGDVFMFQVHPCALFPDTNHNQLATFSNNSIHTPQISGLSPTSLSPLQRPVTNGVFKLPTLLPNHKVRYSLRPPP